MCCANDSARRTALALKASSVEKLSMLRMATISPSASAMGTITWLFISSKSRPEMWAGEREEARLCTEMASPFSTRAVPDSNSRGVPPCQVSCSS